MAFGFKFMLSNIKESVLHLFFPHICAGCNTDLLSIDNMLCIHCHSAMPSTMFHMHGNNPIEKLFWGRLPVTHGSAQYYFTKESLMQRLMHQFKYKGNQQLGLYLGRMMGHQLIESNRFAEIDALVPLPLHPSKERKRGFNQAAILCNGISEILKKPVLENIVERNSYTETQTKKNRLQRWQNMEGRFELVNKDLIENKHILLVDDVITTGATLEACGQAILTGANVRISIVTLCFSS